MTSDAAEREDRLDIFMRVCAGLLTHVGVPQCSNVDAILRAARVHPVSAPVPAPVCETVCVTVRSHRAAIEAGHAAGRQEDSVIPFAQQSYMDEEAGHEQPLPAGVALPEETACRPAAPGQGMHLPPDAMNSELIMDSSSDVEDEAGPITYMRMRDYVAALLRDDLLC